MYQTVARGHRAGELHCKADVLFLPINPRYNVQAQLSCVVYNQSIGSSSKSCVQLNRTFCTGADFNTSLTEYNIVKRYLLPDLSNFDKWELNFKQSWSWIKQCGYQNNLLFCSSEIFFPLTTCRVSSNYGSVLKLQNSEVKHLKYTSGSLKYEFLYTERYFNTSYQLLLVYSEKYWNIVEQFTYFPGSK